jgi:hypothetical protein
MLPEELCLGTWRDTPPSDEALKASVQNIEEARLQAGANLLSYQEVTQRWKNKKIRPKLIRLGDLVLCQIPKAKLKGKMHCKWEGSFIATTMTNEVDFKLRRLSGVEEPYTSNVDISRSNSFKSRRGGGFFSFVFRLCFFSFSDFVIYEQ